MYISQIYANHILIYSHVVMRRTNDFFFCFITHSIYSTSCFEVLAQHEPGIVCYTFFRSKYKYRSVKVMIMSRIFQIDSIYKSREKKKNTFTLIYRKLCIWLIFVGVNDVLVLCAGGMISERG